MTKLIKKFEEELITNFTHRTKYIFNSSFS